MNVPIRFPQNAASPVAKDVHRKGIAALSCACFDGSCVAAGRVGVCPSWPRVRLRCHEVNDSQPRVLECLEGLALLVREFIGFGQHKFECQITAVVARLRHSSAVAELCHGVDGQLSDLS